MIGQQESILLGRPTNYLIVKDDVGRPKPSTRRLPSNDFAYGKSNMAEVGASTIVNEWKVHEPTLPDIFKNTQPRDFKTLNKKAAVSGMTTSKMNS